MEEIVGGGIAGEDCLAEYQGGQACACSSYYNKDHK